VIKKEVAAGYALLAEYKKSKIEVGMPMGRGFHGYRNAFGRIGGIYQRGF
jgi:hypothetical protein